MMTCEEMRKRLDAYADGSLPPAEVARVEVHLETCAECAAFLVRAADSLSGMGSLPRSIEPRGDLWPAIRARLTPRGGSRRRVAVPGWWLAAAAVTLIVASSIVTALLVRRPATSSVAGAPVRLVGLEVQYAAATAELTQVLEQARDRLAPETVATIERNLAVIDSALAESRRALARDPANAALAQLVLAAWRQKMDYLRRATALPVKS